MKRLIPHTLVLLLGGPALVGGAPRDAGLTAWQTSAAITATVTVNRAPTFDANANTSLTPSAPDPALARKSRATYSVGITGLWTAAVTPAGPPGGAHFTTFVGGVHNDQVTFFRAGQMASAGVELMAELGGTSTLVSEVNAQKPNADRSVTFAAPSVTGTRTHAGVTFTSDHPRITLTSMIAPSPDWFVGVSGLSLLNGSGNWVASRSVDLYPWDAGTEDGSGFSLSNPATSPQGVIHSIRGREQFTDLPIARLTFTRTGVEQAPAAPAGFGASASGGAVDLAWTEPTAAGITGHEYRRKTTGADGAWTEIPDSAPGEVNEAGFTVTGLTVGTQYTFELRAVNAVGAGPASAEASAIPTATETPSGTGSGSDPDPEPDTGPALAVTVAPGALRVAAADNPATADTDERRAGYTITLRRRPTGPVTLTPQSSDPAIAVVTGPLTFTVSDWDTPQTLTVRGVRAGRVGIAHRLAGGGYHGETVPEVTVTVGDGGADPRKTLAPPPVDAGEQAGMDAEADIDTTDAADDPDPAAARLPDGALAALARGHLASARQALGPRLNPDADAGARLTLAGQTLSLTRLLMPGPAGDAFGPDRPRLATGLSWDQAIGRCAAWYTASCAAPADGAGPVSADGRGAGAWDTLLYRLTTGLLQGGAGDALWRGSEFALTLGGGEGPGVPGRRWTLWGRGHVQALTGLPAGVADGADLRSGYLGIDTRLGTNARAGFALSRSLGAGALSTVHPYLTWSDGATTFSALGGIGRGRAGPGHSAQDSVLSEHPLGLRMGLVEVQRQLGVLGALTLDLCGDAAWARLSSGDGPGAQAETVRTLRLGAGAGAAWQLGRLSLAPTLAAHLRHDSGHGPRGRGLELLGGVAASHGEMRLSVQGRMLTTRSAAAYRERGLETTLALGRPGRPGPSLAFSARWGDAATGGDTLWREQLHYRHDDARDRAWSLDARSEVGLRLPGGGLLTGFASLSHAGEGARVLFGLRMGLGALTLQ